jgi:hypothetical protein
MVSSSTTAAEVKQMEHRTDPQTIKGSPELAVVLFAILAVFAYILL